MAQVIFYVDGFNLYHSLLRLKDPKVEWLAPPMMGHSNDLLTVCSEKKKISPKQVWACLLPREVKRTDGTVVATRPSKYD